MHIKTKTKFWTSKFQVLKYSICRFPINAESDFDGVI